MTYKKGDKVVFPNGSVEEHDIGTLITDDPDENDYIQEFKQQRGRTTILWAVGYPDRETPLYAEPGELVHLEEFQKENKGPNLAELDYKEGDVVLEKNKIDSPDMFGEPIPIKVLKLGLSESGCRLVTNLIPSSSRNIKTGKELVKFDKCYFLDS